MTIGERFRQIRKNLNQKQDEVAKQLDIGPETLSRYENNKRTPDFDFLKLFGTHFNISGDWLLYGIPPVYRTPLKDQNFEGMVLELLAAIESKGKLRPSPVEVTNIARDDLGSTPNNLIPMLEYMHKDPLVCRNMLQFFFLFQKPEADKRLADAGTTNPEAD